MMIADGFELLVRTTLASSIAIALVLALRAPVRRLSGAVYAYALWLLVPLATAAVFLPLRRIDAPVMPTADSVARSSGSFFGQSAQPAPYSADDIAGEWALSSLAELAPYLLAVWAAGALIALAVLGIRQQRFVAGLGLTPLAGESDVHVARSIRAGPALVGVLRPRIVVPADFTHRYDAGERALILAHERAHLAGWDAQINALASLATCLAWFNPLVHAARARLRVDQELACDARVMARHGDARRAYAETMLKTQIAGRIMPLSCAWPAGAHGALRLRLTMLQRSKPPRIRRALGALACMALSLGTAAAVSVAQPARIGVDTDALGVALIVAAAGGDAGRVNALIEQGADPNAFLPGDGTPLIVAVRQGHDDLVDLLLRAGADVNRSAPRDGAPLIAAAQRGDVRLAEILLDHGADANLYVSGDETPLISAARGGSTEVAALLIDRGAHVDLEVDAPTSSGVERRSPISEAMRHGHEDMIALLRARGAGA